MAVRTRNTKASLHPLPSGIVGFCIGRLTRRPPDFVIGGDERPYLKRWRLLPRQWPFNVYLHLILRDDDDRALHDHPWRNVSIVLARGYFEHLPTGHVRWRNPGSIVHRQATDAHRIAFFQDRPAWSLFLIGRRVRDWGFWCPQGWVRWQDFVASDDAGSIGRGCNQ